MHLGGEGKKQKKNEEKKEKKKKQKQTRSDQARSLARVEGTGDAGSTSAWRRTFWCGYTKSISRRCNCRIWFKQAVMAMTMAYDGTWLCLAGHDEDHLGMLAFASEIGVSVHFSPSRPQ